MYERTFKLQHDEIPATINVESGEIKQLSKRPNNIPEDKEIFEPSAKFRKDYTNSWKYLRDVLSPLEYKAAHTLALLAKANTNSLEPLNDETTLKELMEILDVSINKVKPILATLWDLGVYGRFDVKEADKPYTKYWVFNPYLSFSGKILLSDVSGLFKGTHVAKAFYNPEHMYKRKKIRN